VAALYTKTNKNKQREYVDPLRAGMNECEKYGERLSYTKRVSAGASSQAMPIDSFSQQRPEQHILDIEQVNDNYPHPANHQKQHKQLPMVMPGLLKQNNRFFFRGLEV